MSESYYYKYYKEMNDHSIDLAFKGPFSHEILLSLADTLLGTISIESEKQKVPKKVFAIFVELTQNIRDYSVEKKSYNNKQVGSGIIVLKDSKDCYNILSGNMVKKSDSEEIREYIDYLNSLDKAELKALYREKLSTENAGSNGGVGLIHIARKSENKFELKMEPVDDEYNFFVLTTKVDKEI